MLNEYEKYQLDWLKEHGHSISELINKLEQLRKETLQAAIEDGTSIDISVQDLYENWEEEIGFSGSEIWACEKEWKDNESELEEKIPLYDIAMTLFAVNPYKLSKNAKKETMYASEWDYPADDIKFEIDSTWVRNFAQNNYSVTDFDDWRANEYTHEDSEAILISGIVAGAVYSIEKKES